MSKKNNSRRSSLTREQEYDKTKDMMDKLRGRSKSNNLNEQEAEEDPLSGDDYIEQNEETPEDEAVDLPSDELRTEKQKFRETVDSRVEFETFKIYPKARNVIFAGVFQGFGGLHWQFTLTERDGVYISVDNLQLSDEAFEVLKKLKGYYENWADEWSQKIVEEYTNEEEGEEEDEMGGDLGDLGDEL